MLSENCEDNPLEHRLVLTLEALYFLLEIASSTNYLVNALIDGEPTAQLVRDIAVDLDKLESKGKWPCNLRDAFDRILDDGLFEQAQIEDGDIVID